MTSWKAVEQEDQNRTWVCDRPLRDPGEEKQGGGKARGGLNLGGDLSLPLCLSSQARQLPVTVAWAMAEGLPGMLGAQ